MTTPTTNAAWAAGHVHDPRDTSFSTDLADVAMTLKQDIEWYAEGERDQDFLAHLASLAIPRIAELEAEVLSLVSHKAVISANDKLTEAQQQLRDLADRAVLQAKAADQAPAVGPDGGAGGGFISGGGAGGAGFLAHAAKVAQVFHEIAYVVNSGAADSDGLTVTATVDTVDPVTGEVAESVTTDVEHTCQQCGGEGRLPDRTGGGHHRCKVCAGTGRRTVHVPVVLVAWPNNPDMQTVEVGPLTRFGELAAGYLASLPADDPRRADAFSDYAIIDVDAGSERDGRAVITGSDHGLCFSVERSAL